MYNVLSAEILKLRRSGMVWLAVIAGFAPASVKFIRYIFQKGNEAAGWEGFLKSHQEFMVLGVLTAVVLISGFIFNMEYQYNTAACIFTSRVSRGNIFIAKLISVLAVIIFLLAVSAVSHLIFGFLAVRAPLPQELLYKYMETIFINIFLYFFTTALIALISIVIKKFVVSAAVVLGYIILVFPFHMKGNVFICPFMAPAAISAKILGSDDYIWAQGYLKGSTFDFLQMAGFMAAIFLLPFIVGLIYYKKSDAF